jgi:hypothetical protein
MCQECQPALSAVNSGCLRFVFPLAGYCPGSGIDVTLELQNLDWTRATQWRHAYVVAARSTSQ